MKQSTNQSGAQLFVYNKVIKFLFDLTYAKLPILAPYYLIFREIFMDEK